MIMLFEQKHVFIFGPIALPDELKNGNKLKNKNFVVKNFQSNNFENGFGPAKEVPTMEV